MNAEIISIGDELIIGQTVNTNASFIAGGLTNIGITVDWVTTVGDNAEYLHTALDIAMNRCNLILATGGLGPTHDDISKKIIAEYFNSGFVHSPEVMGHIKTMFAKRNIKMSKVNDEQALVPEKAKIITNPVGTAPGMLFEKEGKKCFVLPGVPYEMRIICEETIFPMLQNSDRFYAQKSIKTTGVAESILFEKLGDIAKLEKLAKLAFLPKPTGVELRISVHDADRAAGQKKLAQAQEMIENKVGQYIFAYDNETLEDIIARLLTESGRTIAVAESCTGGLLANKLTNVSGSSAYFERGVVTYSNQAKMSLLGVPENTLETHGAVSAETAEAMAAGIRRLAGTDFGVSTTGIAGPTGGTTEKPVGLVYIGFADSTRTFSKRFVFSRDRLTNKERTVQAVLNILRKEL